MGSRLVFKKGGGPHVDFKAKIINNKKRKKVFD
jgi:hypothetical protein